MQDNSSNTEKNRKSEAQEIYEQAENAGRFAGDDADARAAQAKAEENIRQETIANRGKINKEDKENIDTDVEAHRDPAKVHDYKGEAQNVNDDTNRPMSGDEAAQARNKATEGIRQQREDS